MLVICVIVLVILLTLVVKLVVQLFFTDPKNDLNCKFCDPLHHYKGCVI